LRANIHLLTIKKKQTTLIDSSNKDEIISLSRRFSRRICLRAIVSLKSHVENISWKRRKWEKEKGMREKEKTKFNQRPRVWWSFHVHMIMNFAWKIALCEAMWHKGSEPFFFLACEPHSFMAHRYHYKVANPRFSRYNIDRHTDKGKKAESSN